MKKVLGFMFMALAVVLPFNVKAATSISFKCGEIDANGNKTCTITANTTDNSAVVTLTEVGGAAITSVVDGDWTVSNTSHVDSVWTVEVSGPDTGEINLFSFTYKVSGTEDCKIIIRQGSQSVEVTEPTPDKPTENKQTGSTLPYIALGAIAILAGGAYVSTKNKAKMYRI